MIDKRSNIHRWAFLTIHLILITTPARSFSPITTTSNAPVRTETVTTCLPSIILLNQRPNRHTSSSLLYLRQGEDDENVNEDDLQNECNDDTKPTWIEKSMGTTPEDPTPKLSLEPPLTTMRRGIAGFAVDPHVGFVCVLHHDNEDGGSADIDVQSSGQHQFVYTVISTLDRSTVQSAEALCLVQLAGGLDLGAVVFPPDTLARLVKMELDDGDKASVEDLRSRVRLLAITVIEDNDGNDDPTKEVKSSPLPSSNDERDEKIAQSSAKIMTAVMNLPGLNGVTEDRVGAAMQLHANSNGNIDRLAFSELLDTLRRNTIEGGENAGGGNLKFRLTASLAKEDSNSPSTLVDFYASAFESIGLALRYKVKVTVSKDCLKGGMELDGMGKVIERFPAFRPVQELEEDASIMDGFIPSMFFKENSPDNDDKA